MPGLTTEMADQITPGFSGEIYPWEILSASLSLPISLPRPVHLHIVRHGETEANAHSLVTGARDSPLTPRGREQAQLVGRGLSRQYNVAFHSKLSRSAETLQLSIESGQVEVGAVYADCRLNERSLGELELTPVRPIKEFARGDLTFAPAGGDSYAEVSRRLLSFLLDLTRFVCHTNASAILICGHMGPMRILAGIFEGSTDSAGVLARSFRNTEVLRIRWDHLAFPSFLTGLPAKTV